jgi:hypothetical protein
MLLALVTLSVNQANVVPMSIEKQSSKESALAINAFWVECFFVIFMTSFKMLSTYTILHIKIHGNNTAIPAFCQ